MGIALIMTVMMTIRKVENITLFPMKNKEILLNLWKIGMRSKMVFF